VKRWLIRVGIFVGLIFLLTLVAALTQSVIATRKLKAVSTRLERDAIPLSWHELYAQFPDVDAHRAAQSTFFAALDGLTNLPSLSDEQRETLPVEGLAELPEIGSNVPPQIISSLDARLRDAAPALEALRGAVANDPFWLIPPTNAFNVPTLSRLATVRQAARLFNMSAILHSERGEPLPATQAVLDGIRLAQAPHRGSLLIDELVRFACEGLAIRSLEYALAKTAPPLDRLRELQSEMSEHADMRTGILGEIVYTKQIYAGMSALSRSDMETMIELSDSEPWQYVIAYLPVSSGWLRMNEAYHLELLHHVAQTWHLPWQSFTNRYAEASDSIPWPYFLPNLSKDVYSSVKNRELRAAGAWRCGRIAIAIERYSQEHGQLPDSLTNLTPEYLEHLPTEPFHGGPFEYSKEGNTGTLRFTYPDSDLDFTFKVFAETESTEPEN
jgi:hypothetical protein